MIYSKEYEESIVETWVSYGGGVQTFGMLLAIRQGIIPKVNGFIFSDTKAEYPETYIHIQTIVKPLLEQMNIPFVEVSKKDGIIEGYKETNTIPIAGFRSCTMKYKVEPIQKYFRSRIKELGIKKGRGKPIFKMLIGISSDESGRAISPKNQKPKWLLNSYPFLELDWSRKKIIEFIQELGFEVPRKSGCYMCPYSGLKGFVNLKVHYPDLFKNAIEMEDLYFKNRPERIHGFLSSSMIKLRELEQIPTLYSFVDKLPEETGGCKNTEIGGCFL